MNTFDSVYMTFPDQKSAQKVSEHLLNQRLVACTNCFSSVLSQYWWQGEIQTEHEVVLIAKAPLAHRQGIMELVSNHHPYQVPCVLFRPIEAGHPAYLAWLAAATGSGPS